MHPIFERKSLFIRENLMRKKIAIAITTAAVATSLTACGGAGNDAPTRMIKQVTDGVEAQLDKSGNKVVLRNIYVTVNDAGDAALVGTIINHKPTQDALIALAINQMQIKLSPIPVFQDKPVIFGGDSANAIATIPNSGLVPGNRTTVSFFFGLAGTVSVDALIVKA
jgi:hypothetical protein